MNILIVEDQALIALDLKLILEELNYSVCGVAQNYHQAIDLLETGNPDLVLLDINLNDNKNGIDIAHHINKKIPHVFVTANDDQLMFEKIKETNPYGYINKPFQISDIHSSIEIALNKFKHDQKLKIKQETLSLINNKLEDKIAQNLKESNLLVQHLKQEMILRNNIELELIEKENLLREIFNSVSSAMILTDKEYNIITCNPAFFKIFETNKITPLNLYNFFIERKIVTAADFDYLSNNKELEKAICINKEIKHLHFNYFKSSYKATSNFNIVFSITDNSLQIKTQAIIKEEKEQQTKAFILGEQKERERISRELHDSLGQKLTAIKLNMAALNKQENLPTYILDIISQTKKLVEDTINETREISHNLSPSILNDYGLGHSLKKLVADLEKNSSCSITLLIQNNFPRINIHFETNLYRIIQEGINNSIKHAQAKNISLHLQIKENNNISICIEDDGIGFNPLEDKNLGKGIINMKERCLLIGAKLEINSRKKKGTKICIELENKNNL